jgi:hypothetical protein
VEKKTLEIKKLKTKTRILPQKDERIREETSAEWKLKHLFNKCGWVKDV